MPNVASAEALMFFEMLVENKGKITETIEGFTEFECVNICDTVNDLQYYLLEYTQEWFEKFRAHYMASLKNYQAEQVASV